jgi:hypothetical protein
VIHDRLSHHIERSVQNKSLASSLLELADQRMKPRSFTV